MTESKKRLDLRLVELGFVSSRTKAQDLIKTGCVLVFGKPVFSSSFLTTDEMVIQIQPSELDRYVSRGGLKLEGALLKTKIPISERRILDVGISTGGFSDCLLQQGARQVTGVDVGHDQLHALLRSHPHLTCIEGVNARELDQNPKVLAQMPGGGWDLAVIDVSFISLTLILGSVRGVIKPGGSILALVKPQFEVGPDGLGKGGLVKDPSLYPQIEAKMRSHCEALQIKVRDYFDSPIEGKDGNREFFIWLEV